MRYMIFRQTQIGALNKTRNPSFCGSSRGPKWTKYEYVANCFCFDGCNHFETLVLQWNPPRFRPPLPLAIDEPSPTRTVQFCSLDHPGKNRCRELLRTVWLHCYWCPLTWSVSSDALSWEIPTWLGQLEMPPSASERELSHAHPQLQCPSHVKPLHVKTSPKSLDSRNPRNL